MRTNLSKLNIGQVYEAEWVQARDIPDEKLIAIQFDVPEVNDRPVYISSYKKSSKQKALDGFEKRFKVPLENSDSMRGSKWYVCITPDYPKYLYVVKKVANSATRKPQKDEWGFPIQ